ncbi:hypothetical protein COU54_05590 [Candidatus Pacearchaeota archaeon CG10_big_fil_rev_8_21_14_0_10_31_24]|nr:MAG: hypothetical protein COU54_05590 [Candidatus Pacearchaeota archaeon CG10_big_fil_rev_8_21_14_0_10_31_24]
MSSLRQGISMRLELSQHLPSMVCQTLLEVPDGALEEMLEQALTEIKIHKSKNSKGNKGNFFDTYGFFNICKRFTGKVNTQPLYSVNLNGDIELTSLRDFSGVHKALSNYHVPEGENSRTKEQNFSLKFLESLDWRVKKQKDMVTKVIEKQRLAIESQDPNKLTDITYASLGKDLGVHETTANRLAKGLVINLNDIEMPLSDFIISEGSGLVQLQLKKYILEKARELEVYSLDKLPLSDQRLTKEYNAIYGTNIARRTFTKARINLKSSNSLRIGIQKPRDIEDIE